MGKFSKKQLTLFTYILGGLLAAEILFSIVLVIAVASDGSNALIGFSSAQLSLSPSPLSLSLTRFFFYPPSLTFFCDVQCGRLCTSLGSARLPWPCLLR